MKEIVIKQRFYPTDEQAELLARTFGCVRTVYNRILRWRTDAYRNDKIKVNYSAASSRLTELKKDPELSWLNDVSCVPLQQSLRHQQAAFKNFFEGRAKYPVEKKKRHKQSAEFTKSAFKFRDGQLFIAKSKQPLNIRWSRELPSEPTTVTISKDTAGRYFVSMLCRFEPKPMPVTAKTVGIDLGLNNLFITDSGEKVDNPRHFKRYQNKLAYLQRKLINENQVVCVESLQVKNMLRNPKLAKHIADASWGEFVRQLKYKAEWAGRTIVEIDRFFPSSKRCSCCGFVHESMTLNIRNWTCPECNTHHDRDINAAKNIKTAGLAGLA